MLLLDIHWTLDICREFSTFVRVAIQQENIQIILGELVCMLMTHLTCEGCETEIIQICQDEKEHTYTEETLVSTTRLGSFLVIRAKRRCRFAVNKITLLSTTEFIHHVPPPACCSQAPPIALMLWNISCCCECVWSGQSPAAFVRGERRTLEDSWTWTFSRVHVWEQGYKQTKHMAHS